MRKILAILFSIAFLLVFVSLFSQKSLAAACSYAGTYVYNYTPNPYGNTPGAPTSSQEIQRALDDAVSKCTTAKSTDCTAAAASIQSEIKSITSYNQSSIYSKYCKDTADSGNLTAQHHSTCNITISATCPSPAANTNPPGSTTTTDTGTVASGSYGCAYKLDDAHTPVSGFSCKDGATCSFVPNTSTFDIPGGKVDYGYCQPPPTTDCKYCGFGFQPLQQGPHAGVCQSLSNDQDSHQAKLEKCPVDQCSPVYGCQGPGSGNPPLSICGGIESGNCDTAIGSLPTNPTSLLTQVFSIVLAIAGVAALGLIIASGYRLMVSQGNPEQVKGAREQLTAAIIGLLFIIFSLVILQVIGANILKIPGFGA